MNREPQIPWLALGTYLHDTNTYINSCYLSFTTPLASVCIAVAVGEGSISRDNFLHLKCINRRSKTAKIYIVYSVSNAFT